MAKSKRARKMDRKLTRPDAKPKSPRQASLPGTEDRAIKALEDVAASYAEIRDERMALTQREAELKQTALKLMHKFDKTIYRRNGIEIRLVEGEEDVKVRIKKPNDDEPDDADPSVLEAEREDAERDEV